MEVILEKEMNECKKTRKVIVDVKKKRKEEKETENTEKNTKEAKNSDWENE